MNATQEYLLLADGRNIPIYIRQSSRARRILLKVGPYDKKVGLTAKQLESQLWVSPNAQLKEKL